MVDVSISVLTYLRNDDLRGLLPLLLREIAAARGKVDPSLGLSVLVVDNDPSGGAREVVTKPLQAAGVRYVLEPTPGIAAARNRALDEASVDGVVVFIDDDERPEAGWLASMLSTWERHTPAAVGGPVEAFFETEIDPWIVAGGYFERDFRSSFRTGQEVQVAPTGNILLDMTRINAHGLRFDVSLGLAGGEDTLFTRQLVGFGEKIVWCNEAVVLDPVPPSRSTRRWVVARVFFVSNASISASLKAAGSWRERWRVRLRYGATGGARIVLGTARTVTGTLTRRTRDEALGVSTAARGAGALAAVLGLRFEEYRR